MPGLRTFIILEDPQGLYEPAGLVHVVVPRRVPFRVDIKVQLGLQFEVLLAL